MFDVEKVDKAIEHIAETICATDIKDVYDVRPMQLAEIAEALSKLIDTRINYSYYIDQKSAKPNEIGFAQCYKD